MSLTTKNIMEVLRTDYPGLSPKVYNELEAALEHLMGAMFVILGEQPQEDRVKAIIAAMKSLLYHVVGDNGKRVN
jgi:hypothetical protein